MGLMPREEADAEEFRKALEELKRTLPEDQYKEIESQIKSTLIENAENARRERQSKSGCVTKPGVS